VVLEIIYSCHQPLLSSHPVIWPVGFVNFFWVNLLHGAESLRI